eukprot:1161698-Pelagomonas_calceolata.AAC.17
MLHNTNLGVGVLVFTLAVRPLANHLALSSAAAQTEYMTVRLKQLLDMQNSTTGHMSCFMNRGSDSDKTRVAQDLHTAKIA